MTLTTTTSRADYNGNGSTTAFPVPFRFLQNADLRVIHKDGSGVETTLVLNTDYTVAGAGAATGTVTLATAPASGETLTILRVVTPLQATSFRNQGSFFPETHEDALDLLTMAAQQSFERETRTLKLPESISGATVDTTLPTPLPGAALAWNAAGDGLGNLIGESSGTVEDARDLALADLASTADPAKGDALVTVKQPYTSSVARTQHDKNAETVSVLDFGADPTGVASSSAAFDSAAASGAKRVDIPSGTYLLSSTLPIPDGQAWFGKSGKRYATIKKGFSGDLITLGSGSTLVGINIDGNGATYTGRCVVVSSGYSQVLQDVRIAASAGVALEFEVGVGGGACIRGLEAETTNPTLVPAVKISDSTGPSPKFFDGIWLSGGLFDFAQGGNGSSLTNFYIRNFVTSFPITASCSGNVLTVTSIGGYCRILVGQTVYGPGIPAGTTISSFGTGTGALGTYNLSTTPGTIASVSMSVSGAALFHISNGRCASIADTTTLTGSDVNITNVAFSGPVAFYGAQGYMLRQCTLGSGFTEDATTCAYNAITNQPATYLPAWSQSSGTGPTIGSGTLTGIYCRDGYTCSVNIRLVFAADTTVGDGTGSWRLSLPFYSSQGMVQRGIAVMLEDASGTTYTAWGSIGTNQNVITLGINGAGVRKDVPFVWATGDTINLNFTYMVK